MDPSTQHPAKGTNGETATTKFTLQSAYLWCSGVNPNCVETVSGPFDRMDCVMRDIDNAISRQQIAIKSFTETVQKFRNSTYHSNGLRSLDSVRY